jgi:hypothetical protein
MSILLNIYNNAVMPVHDNDPIYENTVPFCKKGVERHVLDLPFVGYEENFHYMGQFNDSSELSLEYLKNNFQFFSKYPERHILDIEGDWGYRDVPKEIFETGCKISMNGVKSKYSQYLNNIFIRPTFSKNLMRIVKRKAFYHPNYNRSFSFMGFPDPFGIRREMKKVVDDRLIPSNIIFTDKWKGGSDNIDDHQKFADNLMSGTFSLCPRGTGVDSVRFLESCFYGRIPIVISDNICFGHDFNKPFYFQMDRIDSTAISEISKLPINVINEYSSNAVEFFNTYVKDYFADPTLSFIKWMNG